jgi:hypothetical protein
MIGNFLYSTAQRAFRSDFVGVFFYRYGSSAVLIINMPYFNKIVAVT